MILVYKETKEGEERKTWAELDEAGVTMSFETIVHPFAEADVLQAIYVNMDSSVLKVIKPR